MSTKCLTTPDFGNDDHLQVDLVLGHGGKITMWYPRLGDRVEQVNCSQQAGSSGAWVSLGMGVGWG